MKGLGILLSLFILVPLVEFALLIEIGRRLGTISTLILIFGTGVVGAYLARLEGLRILYRNHFDYTGHLNGHCRSNLTNSGD